VLRSGDALDIHRVVEIAKVLVGLTDAIVLWTVAILDIGHSPCLVANELEGT
jgi:hypothetical protein